MWQTNNHGPYALEPERLFDQYLYFSPFEKILQSKCLKCEYFVVSLLLCDSKLIIFGLWTKRDIRGCHPGTCSPDILWTRQLTGSSIMSVAALILWIINYQTRMGGHSFRHMLSSSSTLDSPQPEWENVEEKDCGNDPRRSAGHTVDFSPLHRHHPISSLAWHPCDQCMLTPWSNWIALTASITEGQKVHKPASSLIRSLLSRYVLVLCILIYMSSNKYMFLCFRRC